MRAIRLFALAILLTLIAAASFVGFALLRLHGELADAHDRVPAATRAALDTQDADGVETVLVIGDDSRDPDQRGAADSILLVRAREGRPTIELAISSAVLLDAGRDADSASNLYAANGADGLIDALERTLGTRIDDVAIVGFAGTRSVVDGLGGIDVDSPEQLVSVPFEGRTWRFDEGRIHLSGSRALAYARARDARRREDPDLAGADRLVRQQLVASAIAAQFEPDDLYHHPFERPRLALGAVATSLGVRDGIRIAEAVTASGQLGCVLGGRRTVVRAGETPDGTSADARRDGSFVVASQDDVRQLWRMVTGADEPDVIVRSTSPTACAVGDRLDPQSLLQQQ